MTTTEMLFGLALGVGLSAACGFRVFVPLLLLSAAALAGRVPLGTGFAWLGTWPALTVLAAATLCEIAAYYVPWLDHLLDGLAGPAAVAAGTILTAAQLTELDPLWKWSLALVAGGGTAGAVKGLASAVRGVSTVTTGGLANPVFATIELGASLVTTVLALLLPLAVVAILVAASLWTLVWLRKCRAGRGGLPAQA
jgi:hypothetical protein